MEHEVGTAPTEPRGSAAASPIVRPVHLPGLAGSAGAAGPGGPPPGGWYRRAEVRTAGAVLLGVVIGMVPGLVLAMDARLASQAAQDRASAAEEAVRLWQQQQAEESGVAPSASSLTGVSPTRRRPAGEGGTGGGSTGASASPSASPSGSPRRVSGEGRYRVGVDIRPGVWRSKANNGCHWERQRITTNGRIVVGYGNPLGDATVTIRSTDDRFTTSKCNDWFRIG